MDMNITYFCFLSFPGAAILNIYDAIWLPNCLQQKKNVYSEQYRQPYDVINFKMAARDIYFCTLNFSFCVLLQKNRN